MKIPKKVYLIAAILLFAGGAGTALALVPEAEAPKTINVEQVSATTPAVASESTEVVAEVPVEQPTPPNPAPKPQPEPRYGADPQRPGYSVILDKNWLFDQVGITDPEEKASAALALVKLSGGNGTWTYDTNGVPSLCHFFLKVKTGKPPKSPANDPVAQLKECRDFLISYEQHPYLGKSITLKWRILADSMTN